MPTPLSFPSPSHSELDTISEIRIPDRFTRAAAHRRETEAPHPQFSDGRCLGTVLRMTDAATWVQAVSTLVLLAVTGYYAWKTKDMADSASKSVEQSVKATEAAERSSEAARDAARVAQSKVSPEFSGRRVAAKNTPDDGHTACLQIESTGDAVIVRGVDILRAFRRSTLRDGVQRIDVENEPLEPWGIDTVLPRRLHAGETILVTHPELQDARDDPLDYFILQVKYAFDEDGNVAGERYLKIDERPPMDPPSERRRTEGSA